jgi:hypothetical protein
LGRAYGSHVWAPSSLVPFVQAIVNRELLRRSSRPSKGGSSRETAKTLTYFEDAQMGVNYNYNNNTTIITKDFLTLQNKGRRSKKKKRKKKNKCNRIIRKNRY